MDLRIISDRPPTAERVPPMTLRDMDVVITDGHPMLVDHRRTDVDDALLPFEVARLVLLDLLDPATGEWRSVRVGVRDTVALLLHGVQSWPRPEWSCPFTPFGCRFAHITAANAPLAREALLEHLDRWHHHEAVAA